MINISDDNRTLLVVAGVLLLIYLLLCPRQGSVQNEGFSNYSNKTDDSYDDGYVEDHNDLPHNMDRIEGFADNDTQSSGASSGASSASASAASAASAASGVAADAASIASQDQYFESNDYAPPQQYLDRKFTSRNRAPEGEYKHVSYAGAHRGNLGPNDWDEYFDRHNNIIADSQTGANDQFSPNDETNNGLAAFESDGRAPCGSNQDCKPEDLFDVDKYLPQEINDDWFEVQPEPVSVKNRHLINVTKPIGINTIGTSLRNASYDIRGTPSCPKFVVSPWLQSSIEPDTNLKPVL